MTWSAAAEKFQLFFVFRRWWLKNFNFFSLRAAVTEKFQFFSRSSRRWLTFFDDFFSKIFLISRNFGIKRKKWWQRTFYETDYGGPKYSKNWVFIFMLRPWRLEFPLIIYSNGGGGSITRLTPLVIHQVKIFFEQLLVLFWLKQSYSLLKTVQELAVISIIMFDTLM
jgi:hypothetical protein